jgi:hypothetical protein
MRAVLVRGCLGDAFVVVTRCHAPAPVQRTSSLNSGKNITDAVCPRTGLRVCRRARTAPRSARSDANPSPASTTPPDSFSPDSFSVHGSPCSLPMPSTERVCDAADRTDTNLRDEMVRAPPQADVQSPRRIRSPPRVRASHNLEMGSESLFRSGRAGAWLPAIVLGGNCAQFRAQRTCMPCKAGHTASQFDQKATQLIDAPTWKVPMKHISSSVLSP